jgi:transposase-like protein
VGFLNALRKDNFHLTAASKPLEMSAHTSKFARPQYTLLSMVMHLYRWYQEYMDVQLSQSITKRTAPRPSCPHCGAEGVQKFGQNRGGTSRWRCASCWKTFTPTPNTRTIPALKVDIIKVALAKGCSKHVIAQAVRVSPKTVYRIAEGWVPKGYRPANPNGTPLHLLRDLGLVVKD